MTAGTIPSTQNQRGIRFAQLPAILIVLHAVVMTFAGIAWARNSAEMGSPMAGPGAYFWYDLTRLESFPASYLCRPLAEFLVVQLGSSTDVSASAAISIVYWVLLLVLGAMQWYFLGKLVVWIRRRREIHV